MFYQDGVMDKAFNILLNADQTTALTFDEAYSLHTMAIQWLQPKDPRLDVAMALLEYIRDRTTDNLVKAECYNGLAVARQKKTNENDPLSWELVYKAYETFPTASICLNVMHMIMKDNRLEFFDRILDTTMRYFNSDYRTPDLCGVLFVLNAKSVDRRFMHHSKRVLDVFPHKSVAKLMRAAYGLSTNNLPFNGMQPINKEHAVQEYKHFLNTLVELNANTDETNDIYTFFDSQPKITLEKIGFFHGYTSFGTLEIAKQLALLYPKIYPWLPYTTPTLSRAPLAGRKIRIGFVSAHLREGHTIAKMFGGVIKNLDRNIFEPYIYVNHVSEYFKPYAHKFKTLELMDVTKISTDEWRKQIEEDTLDILVFSDIGMDERIYYLSFARLAPVQVLWWGHTDSACTCIDYFITSKHFNDKQDQYTEKLVKMDTLGVILEKPPVPSTFSLPSSYGIPTTVKRIYMCAQSTHKWTYEYDDIITGILDADPDGIVLAINIYAHDFFQRSIAYRIPSYMSRIYFLPPMTSAQYLEACTVATIMLDTMPFSGSTSHLECFAMGLPVVTLEGDDLKGSLCTGVYRELGVRDAPIAQTKTEYVELAVALAKDDARRSALKDELLRCMDRFYNSKAAITEWNVLLKELAEKHHNPSN